MFNTRPQTPIVFSVVTAQHLIAIRASRSKSCFMALRMVDKTIILDIRALENVLPANRANEMKRVIVTAAGLYTCTADFTSTMCADSRPRICYGHCNTRYSKWSEPGSIISGPIVPPESTTRSHTPCHSQRSITRTLRNGVEIAAPPSLHLRNDSWLTTLTDERRFSS
jgi:hypothetical protein